jgi:hypothetical protein
MRIVATSGDEKKSSTSHKGFNLLTPMLMMRKALEGAKGKMIHRP